MADAKPLAPFTPGPLHVTREVDSEGYCQHTVRASNHVPLAVLSNYSPLEQKANATLYAAAPELLAALQVTRGNVASLGPAGALANLPVYAEYREWLAVLDEVIAKATGAAS
jgi:hypothetical protein